MEYAGLGLFLALRPTQGYVLCCVLTCAAEGAHGDRQVTDQAPYVQSGGCLKSLLGVAGMFLLRGKPTEVTGE